MTLIKSISGIRGTIGGNVGTNLTPIDIVECAAAFGTWVLQKNKNPKVAIGRDARISGNMVQQLVMNTLVGQGITVLDLGLSTTPTVEMAVVNHKADAGVIITASHNPIQWNALKLLNEKGEFIAAEEGAYLLEIIKNKEFTFAPVLDLGAIIKINDAIESHIEAILALPLVDAKLVQSKKFKVVVDCINSTGSISIIPLLEKLGCEVIVLNKEMTGHFAHNPEPLPEHLEELCQAVVQNKAQMGICVDPDVDRLAFVMEDGKLFGEEYSLVAIADYILSKTPGNTVSNLSSTRALRDVTHKHQQTYAAAAVGEVNVVLKMKEISAVLGGEGNGGIIYPELHYGRDALVGVALLLTSIAENGLSMTALKDSLPKYEMSKDKISLENFDRVPEILEYAIGLYPNATIDRTDGVKIDLDQGWIHLRQSNTEPIIRIYTESLDQAQAIQLGSDLKASVVKFLSKT
jgi:phosphomannomutase